MGENDCSRPTRLVEFIVLALTLKQQSADRHVTPLRNITMIPRRPVFVLSS